MNSTKTPFQNDIFFSTNSAPAVILDLEFNIIDANKAALHTLQYKLSEVLGKKISEFSNAKNFTIDYVRVNNLLEGKIPAYVVTKKFTNKSGSTLNYEITISKVLHPETKQPCFVGVFNQLSFQKTKTEINFQEEIVNTVIDKSPVIQYILDVDNDINIYENRSLSEYLGYSKDDFKGKNEFEFLDSLFTASEFKIFKNKVSEYKKSNNPDDVLEIEYSLTNKKGEKVWLYDKSVALKIKETGKKALSYGVIIDITERKLTEEKLKTQTVLLEKISRTIPAFTYILGRDRQNVLFSNQKSKEVTGYTENEFNDLITEEVVHPSFFVEYEKEYKNFISSKTKNSYEIKTKLKHNTLGYRWYEIKSVVFDRDENNVPINILRTLTDIHDKVEERLASAEKDDFIKNVTSKLPTSVYVRNIASDKILFSNIDKKNKLGYTNAEWQKNYKKIIHKEHLPLVEDSLKEFLKNPDLNTKVVEVLIKHKTLGYRWYSIKYKIFKTNIYNEAIEILELIEDIHDEKLSNTKINEQQNLIETITNSIDMFMYMYDVTKKKYTFTNFIDRKIFGYTQKEYLYKSHNYIHPNYKNEIADIVKELNDSETRNNFSLELLVKHKSKGYIWAQLKIIILERDKDGKAQKILEIVEEIDDTKRKSLQIIEQQELIEKISVSIPDFIYLKKNFSNEVIFSNNKSEDILGYSDSFFVQNSIDLVHPNQLKALKANQLEIVNNPRKNQFSQELLIKHKEEGYKWYLNKSIIFERDENNVPIKTLELISDINESKLSNERIKDQQKFIENISSTIPQYLSVYDLKTKKSIYCNFDNKLIFGYTRAEYNAKSNELIHPEQRERTTMLANKMISSKSSNYTKALEFQIKHKTQGYVWAKLKILITERDKNNKALQALEIIENIDKSKKSYNQILEQQNFIQKIASTVTSIIQVTDIAKNKVIYTNFENRTFLGYNKQQWNATGLDIIHPEYVESYRNELRNMAFKNPSKLHSQELLIKDGNGAYKWIQAVNSAFKIEDGQAAQIMTVFRDINDRKNLQIKLEQQLSKNIELERFAAITSHDLKEPLRTLSNYAQILQLQYEDQLEDEGKELLSHITNSSKRMGDLINDILDFARVQTEGKKFEKIDLNDIVKLVTQDLKENITETKSTLNIGVLPVIVGDKTQLRQLFQNLISNAIKFTKEKKPIINIVLSDNGVYHQISVEDNGIGIKESEQKNIFGIFKKLHKENEYEGQGIGLSICKRIIERHDGQIWVESELNKGTTFHLTFPKVKF